MIRASAAVILWMTATTAQAQLPTLTETTTALTGTEVEITGRFGKVLDTWVLHTPESAHGFISELAVDRETLKSVDSCDMNMFRPSTGCEVSGKAEIRVNGGNIYLIIYELKVLVAPATPPS